MISERLKRCFLSLVFILKCVSKKLLIRIKSVSLKMSESEHYDSEFYYPGELLDAEMLQLPTHSEATERKSLLSNEEINKFITSQQQANTVKKTTYDMNLFQRFLNECGKK